MTREEIKKIIDGITDEQLQKVMELHGTATNKLRNENTRITEELQTAKTTISTYETKIKEFDGVDIEGMKKKIGELETDIENRKKADEEALKKQNLTERFNNAAGESNWMNDYTRDGIKAKFISAVEDKANTGKSDVDIFTSLVKDEKGNYYDGLFKSDVSKVEIPGLKDNNGMGKASDTDLRAVMGLPTETK